MPLVRKVLASKAVESMTSPHSIDHYLTQIHPLLTVSEVRGRVVRVEHETDVASTVFIRPTGSWMGFRPGQHVQFGVEVDGKRKIRCFSVSSSTERKDGTFSVSVKAHPDGHVSQFVNKALTPGTVVYLSQAGGEFVLPTQVPDHILLLSGGSGITPVMSMLRSLRDRGHTGRVTFVHYAKSEHDEMFTDELHTIAAEDGFADVVRVYTREPSEASPVQGRFTANHLKAIGIDPATTPTWACGPAGLIDVIRETYKSHDAADNLHVEYFKTPTIDLEAGDATGTLTFDASGTSAANDGRTILEQAEAAGLTPEFGCRMGVCGTCTTQKKFGAVRNVVSGEIAADTGEPIKICVSTPVGDTCVDI